MPQGNPRRIWGPGARRSTWPAADPRRSRIRLPGGSGAVAGLPVVLTVGVNAITETTANIIGSVNPNGSDTVWWITYGTSLPLPGPNNTTPIDIGSTATPLTVTQTLTGLTTGTTYYVTVVGQSSAGTVLGQTISFVALTPPLPVSPATFPVGTPSIGIPHFNVPVSMTNSGITVVDQDALEEIVANITTIVLCPVGACQQLPNFGRPEVLFSQEPIEVDELISSIQELEPRANEDVVSQVLPDGQSWGITLTTSALATQGN